MLDAVKHFDYTLSNSGRIDAKNPKMQLFWFKKRSAATILLEADAHRQHRRDSQRSRMQRCCTCCVPLSRFSVAIKRFISPEESHCGKRWRIGGGEKKGEI